ncbi:restriction endonuclease subunit S [Pseudomonas sp. NEEL19]|uniref:restriction endonuclease subunit S n=1 Tax=Pseudomonas sp. NEEL19 TaxID=2867409 RepID=UPI002368C069|nr:restriction endonuclease subunit S [Pseudomonas sp. NEEL19]WDM58731.1 restriction endonuclease subunit S [Pseudomonas sp. NEEL19]
MSSEWRAAKIEEIAAPYSTALATGPFGSAISSKYFVDSGVPVIRGSNLSADTSTRLIDADLVFVSHEKANEFQRSVAKRGDLVFTCWGTINQVGLIDSRSKFDSYIVSNKQMKLTIDPAKADHRFIYYVFSGPAKQNEILENGIGSSVPGFNLGQLKRHEILLPPVQEQVRIADFLETFDDRITLLRETNATLEGIAQALFKSWFVGFDPVRAKAEGRQPDGMDAATAALFPDSFEESELGFVPKGWRVTACKNIMDVRDGTHDSPKPSLSGYPLITSRHITSGEIIADDAYLIAVDDYLSVSKRSKVDHLDVLITMIGTVGVPAIVLDGAPEFAIKNIGLFKSSELPLLSHYMYILLCSAGMQRYLLARLAGTTQKYLSLKALREISVLVPSTSVLEKFSQVVSPLFEKIHQQRGQIKCLTQLRDTLLPRLISGQLHLPEAEALVAEVAS